MRGRSTTVIRLRIPDTLLLRLRDLAGKQEVTLNEWCRTALFRQASVLPNGSIRRHRSKKGEQG